MERLEEQAHSGDQESSKHKTPPKWINGNMWLQCRHLDATLPVFDRLCRSVMTCAAQWEAFSNTDNPYTFLATPFVLGDWHIRLSQLLLKFSLHKGTRRSSMVRAFAHGAMGRRIDPSW